MKMTISSPTFRVSDNFLELIQQRVLRAIRRFSANIHDVKVVLTDVNASRGGVDKHCRITVSLRNGILTTEALDEKILSAVDQASRRIRRVIKKKIQRPRSNSRRARLVGFSEWGNEPSSVASPLLE